MKVHQGEWRHFCDDPICPDLVWKPSSPAQAGFDVECRCMDAPFAEPSRRREGRQWWRYDKEIPL